MLVPYSRTNQPSERPDERVLSPPVNDDLLQEMCRRILDVVDAERIVLFGSHAYGSPTEDSDIDLLVVADTDEHPHRVASRIYGQLSPRRISLDVVVRTPAQIVDAFGEGFDPFLREVWRKGRFLYERVGCDRPMVDPSRS